jgi:uncharacterized protein (TIGR00369 family)
MTDMSDEDLATLMRSRAGTAFILALGGEIVEASEGKVLMRLPYSRKLVGNPDTGVLHGGAITAMLDHACGMAVGTGLGVIITEAAARQSTSYATLDLRVDYMKAATPEADVWVTGECVKITRQIVFARARAYQDSADDPIATATGTFITTVTRPGS